MDDDSDGDGLLDEIELLDDCDDDNIPTYIDPFDWCDEELPPDSINIPQGFSPNNDGVGDLWLVTGYNDHLCEIRIYNRWGNIVFTDNNWSYEWNGKANGPQMADEEPLPMGTYYYIMEFDRGVLPISGFVFLKR